MGERTRMEALSSFQGRDFWSDGSHLVSEFRATVVLLCFPPCPLNSKLSFKVGSSAGILR